MPMSKSITAICQPSSSQCNEYKPSLQSSDNPPYVCQLSYTNTQELFPVVYWMLLGQCKLHYPAPKSLPQRTMLKPSERTLDALIAILATKYSFIRSRSVASNSPSYWKHTPYRNCGMYIFSCREGSHI